MRAGGAILLLISVAAASAVGSVWVRRFAIASAVLDIPNARSSHTQPIPKGGGLVIAAAALLTVLPQLVLGGLDRTLAAALAFGIAAVAGVGWWDDRHDVPARIRFVVHLFAAVGLVTAVGGVPEVRLGAEMWNIGFAGSVLAVLGLVWMTNLYNFMDGIDGMAGGQAVIGGGFAGALLWSAGSPGLAIVAGALAASALGFLSLNWPPARLFMGDVGSGTLGFAFGALAIAGERTVGVPLLVLLLPFGCFIFDATYTLLRRLARGERVYEAHRSHVYQRLTGSGLSHHLVVSLTLVLSFLLSGVALAAFLMPSFLVHLVLGAGLAIWVIGTALLIITHGKHIGANDTVDSHHPES